MDVKRDYRFSLEENWEINVKPNLSEGVTALAIIDPDSGEIVGWKLHGWEPPPRTIIYVTSTPSDKQAMQDAVDTQEPPPNVGVAESEQRRV